MKTKKLTKQKIDDIFQNAEIQSDYWFSLYRHVFPEWDNIESIDGHPRTSKNTSNYIFDKAIAFDKENHPKVISGGLWMNSGFGSKDDMKDWEVNFNECNIKWKVR